MFTDLDFTLMEMNPFTLDAAGRPFPLDMRGELDDTAAFKSGEILTCSPPMRLSVLSEKFVTIDSDDCYGVPLPRAFGLWQGCS